nr:hypothetical protein BaRGS_005714 [Batillaria attramentaria]
MDQLHEDLKYPVAASDDEEEEEPDGVESGIATPTDSDVHSLATASIGGGDARKMVGRQNSIDSSSSQSECEYETCDSGLSSERGSQVDHNASSDENSDPNEHTSCLPNSNSAAGTGANARTTDSNVTAAAASPTLPHRHNKNRNSTSSSPPRYNNDENIDKVANLKEIKETANLLSKIETDNARQQGCVAERLQKSESGGHYTAYCLNHINEQWYEFDDQYVTEVDVSQVINCEAYVLFYKKNDEHMLNLRLKAMKIRDAHEPSLLQFYVSKQWINRFNTFAEPGPITNTDFLCKHGGVPPSKVGHVELLVEPLEQAVWELLYSKFGGGPVCNRLYPCQVCQQELEALKARQKAEMETFIELNEEFQAEENLEPVIYAMSMAWFKEWEAFVRGKTDSPIDNSRIATYRNGQSYLRSSSDHGQLSRDMWNFLHSIYGGGPELIIRQRSMSTTQQAAAAPSSSPTLKGSTRI